MEQEYLYIEPAALHLKNINDMTFEEIISFANLFDEMLNVLSNSKSKVIIASYIFQKMFDENDKLLIPADLSKISDESIRRLVNQLNQSFAGTLHSLARVIETEPCSCLNDDIAINSIEQLDIFESDEMYYEFYHSLVGECYREGLEISKLIFILPQNTRIKENEIEVRCTCATREFIKEFKCVTVQDFKDSRYEAKESLRLNIQSIKKYDSNEIEAVQADHEPVIGNTIIKRYVDIPANLRRVLDILIKFGLSKVHFHEWKSHRGEKGSIKNCRSLELDSGPFDIIEGRFISTDRSIKVHLYFPQGYGELLVAAIGNNFTYQKVIDTLAEFIS